MLAQFVFFYQNTSVWKCLYLVREPWRRGYHLYTSASLGAPTTMTTTTPRVWHSITHSTRNCWRIEVILLFTELKTTPARLWNYASKVRFLSENFDTKMSIVGLPSDLARSFGAVCAHYRYRVIHRAINYRGFSRRGTHSVRAPSRAPCWIFWNNKICERDLR